MLPDTRLNSDEGPGIAAGMVSCNVFEVFPMTPVLGRLIQPADCNDGAQPVMVLSERYWHNVFDGDPSVIGRTVKLLDSAVTIVGVLSPPFVMNGQYVPLHGSAWVSMNPFADKLTHGGISWLAMAGRLNSGYSRETATAELRILELRTAPSPEWSGRPYFPLLTPTLALTDGSLWATEAGFRWRFLILLVLPSLLMMVTSISVATLLLSRAAGRQQEMAVRLSVGAGRWRLIRMLLVENVLLAGAAAAVSLFLVRWIPLVLLGFLFGDQKPDAMPPAGYFALDWRAFLYLGFCAIAAALFSGVSPALESLNLQLSNSLQGRQFRTGRYSTARLRGLLVTAQIACSMAPLIAVAIFLRMEQRLTDHTGFEKRQVAVIELRRSLRRDQTRAALVRTLEALPGVRSVASAWDYPGMALNSVEVATSETTSARVSTTAVSPEYFKTLGMRLLAGQSFSPTASDPDGSKKVLVSQRFAQRFLPGTNPVGEFLNIDYQDRQIIGIVSDIPGFDLDGAGDGSLVYQPIEAEDVAALMVRFEGSLAALRSAVQPIAERATGGGASVLSLEETIEEQFAHIHRVDTLVGAFGVLSLLLALVGVFGMVSFSTSQRRKETAIRLAVGASPRDVIRTILLRGLRPVPIGIASGLLLAWGLLKIAGSQQILPGALNLADPLPYLVVSALLLGVVMAAILLSAWRAVGPDALRPLREE
jgi:predicted permease